MRYARIVDGAVVQVRDFAVAPDPNPAKGLDWRLCPKGTIPGFDPLTEKITGPTYEIGAASVTESYSKTSLTVEEISLAKDSEVNKINGTDRKALLKILLAIINDNRAIKRKINAVITAAGLATPAFPAAQTTNPANDWTEADLKAYAKGLLD